MSLLVFGTALIIIAVWVRANIRKDAPAHVRSEADLMMFIGAVAIAARAAEAIFK